MTHWAAELKLQIDGKISKYRINFKFIAFFALLFCAPLQAHEPAVGTPSDCAVSLPSIVTLEYSRQKEMLGGDLVRRSVEQFSAQKDKDVSLQQSIELVQSWINEYYRYADRIRDMEIALEQTKIRINILEDEWLSYQKDHSYRLVLPTGVSVENDEVIPIIDPSDLSIHIESRRDVRRNWQHEVATKNKILRLLHQEKKMQAIRHYRFEIILKNREDGGHVVIHPGLRGISLTRLQLIRELGQLVDPEQPLAMEMHPDRNMLAWAKKLARYDSARRKFMRRTGLDIPGRVWRAGVRNSKKLIAAHNDKLAPLVLASLIISQTSFINTQVTDLRDKTIAIAETLEEKTKNPEVAKKELEEKKKIETQKLLLKEAKNIAEKSSSWKELRDGWKLFLGHFPLEATTLYAEVELGLRKDLTLDDSQSPFYFETAATINEWWIRIWEGYVKDGEQLIYGAKGRMKGRDKASKLVDQVFENFENPKPVEPPKASPKKGQK